MFSPEHAAATILHRRILLSCRQQVQRGQAFRNIDMCSVGSESFTGTTGTPAVLERLRALMLSSISHDYSASIATHICEVHHAEIAMRDGGLCSCIIAHNTSAPAGSLSTLPPNIPALVVSCLMQQLVIQPCHRQLEHC